MFHINGPSLVELVIQGLSSTERGYDLLAPKFEYTPFRTPQRVLHAAAASIGTVSSALDLCCGTGAAARMLRPLCRRMVAGIDRSAGMLAEARRLLPEEAGVPVFLIRGDAFTLPFTDVFDVVVCFGAFGHVEMRDHRRFVRSIRRVLRREGRFIFVSSRRPSRWSARYWRLLGFDLVMRFRNAFHRPPFVMYYLNFLLPEVLSLLEGEGFRIDSCAPIFSQTDDALRLVVASKR